MKTFLHLIILSLGLIFIGNACRQKPTTLEPFKWQSIDPRMDSLTLQAEFLWMRDNSLDSILATIKEMEQAAMKLKGEKAIDALARYYYWNGRFLNRTARLEDMEKELNLALQFCDSVRDPYTFGRIVELQYLSSNPASEEFFKFLLSRFEYYKKIRDLTQEANIAVHISNSLNDSYEPMMTMTYLKHADSIYSALRFVPYLLANRINEASLLHRAGQPDSALAILDNLAANPLINRHGGKLELVLRNHYLFFNDSASLFRAYHLIRPKHLSTNNPEADTIPKGVTHIRAFYEALLCNYFMGKNLPDSATRYFALSRRHLSEVKSKHFKANIFASFANYYEETGKPEEALSYLKQSLSLLDSIETEEQPRRKIHLENINTLRIKEIEAKNAQGRIRFTYYLVLAGLLIVLAVIVIIFQHHRQIQKMKTVQTQLELERGQRKLLALSLSKEESNKILDYVKEEVARIGRDGKISSTDIAQIERNLKLHFAGQNEMESFEQTFENVNPDFIKRLKEISPSISENNIRLCSYILIGLSNHQIADLMNVRIASVKQSRWRLRSRLGLTTDQSLEDFLRSLTNKP